eukprot:6175317-Prymnesium_polylepis.1
MAGGVRWQSDQGDSALWFGPRNVQGREARLAAVRHASYTLGRGAPAPGQSRCGPLPSSHYGSRRRVCGISHGFFFSLVAGARPLAVS